MLRQLHLKNTHTLRTEAIFRFFQPEGEFRGQQMLNQGITNQLKQKNRPIIDSCQPSHAAGTAKREREKRLPHRHAALQTKQHEPLKCHLGKGDKTGKKPSKSKEKAKKTLKRQYILCNCVIF